MAHVAIIGAGMAGLSCARRLLAAGVRVDVFEKSRGTGGRLATRRDHGTAFDSGAQYFTARDPRFIGQLQEWQAQGVAQAWPVTPWVLDGGGVVSPSPDDAQRWVGAPGMSALSSALAGRDLALCTRCEAVGVQRDGRGAWWLQLGQAVDAGPFDALVVAMPPAQALRFLDAAPALARVAGSVQLAACWSVALGFDAATGVAFDAAFARGQPVDWLARNSSKPQRPAGQEVWVLHAAPVWSQEHLEAPPEAVARHLARWFGDVVAPQASASAWQHAHRWRHARTTHGVPGGTLLDADARLAVCGDWCHGGRVEGAWLSGLAAAETLLDTVLR